MVSEDALLGDHPLAMKCSVCLAATSLLLLAASCDTAEPPPAPPPAREWTLAPCLDAPGVAGLFVGGGSFTCVSEAGAFESSLDTLGHIGGKIFFYSTVSPQRGSAAFMVLDDLSNFSSAYSIDLRTGEVRLLSVPGTDVSQISAGRGGRFIVADYLRDRRESNPEQIVFSEVRDGLNRVITRIEIPDVGRIAFVDGDYDPTRNESALLTVDSQGRTRVLLVDHDTGTYRMETTPHTIPPTGIRYRRDGVLLVLDSVRGDVYTVPGNRLVISLGQTADIVAYSLFKDESGEVYTFQNDGDGTRVIRLGVDGTETVFRTEDRQRAMYVSESDDFVCLRRFRPDAAAGADAYDDAVMVVDGPTRQQTAFFPTTLDTRSYSFPITFACL